MKTLKVMAVTGLGSLVASAMVRYGVDPVLIYADGFLTGTLMCMVIASN